MTDIIVNSSPNRQLVRVDELHQGDYFEMAGKLYYVAIIYENTNRMETVCFQDKTWHSMDRKTENFNILKINKVNISYE